MDADHEDNFKILKIESFCKAVLTEIEHARSPIGPNSLTRSNEHRENQIADLTSLYEDLCDQGLIDGPR